MLILAALFPWFPVTCAHAANEIAHPAALPTMSELLAASTPTDWRTPDPERTLYLELPAGRVVIELAPGFAPNHVANVQQLSREHYWDGLAVIRVQDDYVVQWADPWEDAGGDNADKKRKVPPPAHARLPAEFESAIRSEVPFTRLKDADTYAAETGFVEGFPVARAPEKKLNWLVHCYGMVGAGRDDAIDSGGGTELYAVIGQAPRQLDRNVTLLGRVISGIERFSSLPRGHGEMGFYTKTETDVPIKSARLASDVPPAERVELEILRTDTPLFAKLIEARRNRSEKWFHRPAGRIDVCNVPLPVRPKAKPATPSSGG